MCEFSNLINSSENGNHLSIAKTCLIAAATSRSSSCPAGRPSACCYQEMTEKCLSIARLMDNGRDGDRNEKLHAFIKVGTRRGGQNTNG